MLGSKVMQGDKGGQSYMDNCLEIPKATKCIANITLLFIDISLTMKLMFYSLPTDSESKSINTRELMLHIVIYIFFLKFIGGYVPQGWSAEQGV